MVDHLEYQRSRIRIARATMLNLIPTGVFGALVVHGIWSVAILFAAAVAFWWVRDAWLKIVDAYEERLLQAYKIIMGNPGGSGRASQPEG